MPRPSRWRSVLAVACLALLLGACSAPDTASVSDRVARAATDGDLEALTALVERSPEAVKAVDEFGYTPLHRAVLRGDRRIVEFLVLHGADVNARTRLGLTPLHLASEEGLAFMVHHLLQSGAAVDPRDEDGMTPLHVACQLGCRESIVPLLEAGADPKARNRKGETPLQLALKADHQHLVPLLVQARARN